MRRSNWRGVGSGNMKQCGEIVGVFRPWGLTGCYKIMKRTKT